MKIGELDVSKIMLGSTEIEKIYLGTEDVYESGDNGGSDLSPIDNPIENPIDDGGDIE